MNYTAFMNILRQNVAREVALEFERILLERTTSEEAPKVDTGRLSQSHIVTTQVIDKNIYINLQSTVDYAKFVEGNTSYISESVEELKTRIDLIIEQVLFRAGGRRVA